MRRKKKLEEWRDPGAGSRLATFLISVGQISAVVLGAIGSGIANFKDFESASTVWGLVLIVASAIIVVVVQICQASRNRRIEEKRNDHVTRFNDQLNGLLSALLKLSSSNRGYEAMQEFIEDTLEAGTHLFSEKGIRLCLYQLESIDDCDEADGSPDPNVEPWENYFLQLRHYCGRQDYPRPKFEPTDSHGEHAIRIALEHVSRGFSQVPEGDSRFSRLQNAAYSSFMEFPLRGKTDPLGALMVDCRASVEWTTEHQATGQTIATLLAHALDSAPEAAEDSSPEIASLQRFPEISKAQS